MSGKNKEMAMMDFHLSDIFLPTRDKPLPEVSGSCLIPLRHDWASMHVYGKSDMHGHLNFYITPKDGSIYE